MWLPQPNPSNMGAEALSAGEMAAPTVVLDTNAVLDAWVFGNPHMAGLIHAIGSHSVRWVSCPAMRDELAHTLRLSTLARWQPDADRVLGQMDAWSTCCTNPERTPLRALWCSDNDDQCFIDLALAQRARWLVTQDRALLRLARKARQQGVLVLPPQRWRLEAGGELARPLRPLDPAGQH